MKPQINPSILAALLGFVFTEELRAQTTAFTYQGHLTENGTPYDGSAEFQFTLWDAESGGTAVATNDPAQLVAPVSNGLFTAALDFGDGVFDGRERFLQIEVRTTIGSFTALSPRQPITPAPLALHATTAVEATKVDMGTIINPTFIGTTTTNAPLEFFANNQRGLRIEPTSATDMVNVIGGSAANSVAEGVVGATIGGGGAGSYAAAARTNRVDADFGTISGGMQNTIEFSAFASTLGGGAHNTIQDNALYAFLGGGAENIIQRGSGFATIPGGSKNSATSFAFAAGRRAKANHRGSFVWADSRDTDFSSIAEDEFAIRALAGVRIANPGSDRTLLRLETERPWEFRQRGSGATTALHLGTVDDENPKNFVITAANVGISHLSPTFKLHVNGSVAGVGPYNNLSDRRYKKDIRSLTNALDTVTRLKGVSFDWRREAYPDMEFERGRQIGFLAQELQSVVPEAVSETEDGTLHAAYGQLIPLLVEAIKEQSHRRETGRQQLERTLQQKDAKIAKLEQRLEKLERLLYEKLDGGRQ